MEQNATIQKLIKACESGKESVSAFSRSIDDFITIVENLPVFARPLVRRDLESNSGLSAEEWKTFLERLSTRFGAIHDEARRVAEALDNSDDVKITEATEALNTASAPLLESADNDAEQMQTMAEYLEGLPAKINMIPDAFLKPEVRKELVDSVPGYVKRALAVKEDLNEAKELPNSANVE